MINLLEVQAKLQEILDSNSNPISQYQFVVETQGFHLDKISDRETGKNFIPVFISTMGGQHNPVPLLHQTEYTIPITFYYPVRFKDDFFLLYDYLVDVFVGQFLTFTSGSARCNIALPQFGEIQDLDFKEFQTWVGSIYRKEIEVMEPYLSMTVTLFMSSSGSNFIYGDNVKITNIQITYGSTQILNDSEPIIIERADIASSETAPQQSFSDTHIKGYPANLGYTKEIPLIIKNTPQYRELIRILDGVKDTQKITVDITERFPFETPLLVTSTYYVTNYTRRTTYAQLLGISLTLADLRDD